MGASSAHRPEVPGDQSRVGRFLLNGKIGAGGMGEVHRAMDTHLGRTVALKLLPGRLASEPERLHRFEQEARAASALNHPNIITVYDAGVADGLPWIAMEYVEGKTLRAIQRDRGGRISSAELAPLAVQVAEGLAKAHDAGIIHRDLKPENIMVTVDGLVKILDFGLAKLVNDSDSPVTPDRHAEEIETELLSRPGSVSGTPGYMAPEQLAGGTVDHRSDQFAFGALLYEMLTGANPFRRQTTAETWSAILEFDPARLDTVVAGVPRPVAAAIARCLSKSAAGRFASTRELVAQLQLEERSNLRRRAPILVAAVVLAIAAGGAWWALRRPAAKPSTPPVVAVRSFRLVSSDPAQEYLSTGISDEVRSQLSKMAAIRLLARSAIDRYADKDLGRLAPELGATRIVEGTVRVENRRLRLSVELSDAVSRQTIWSQEYDRNVDDILAVQSDLAVRIADAMRTQLSPDERRRLGKRPTQSPAAWELYLKANQNRALADRDGNARAIALLKEAVDIDPKFAQAMAGIAYRTSFDPVDGLKNAAYAEKWAERAIAVDPELPQAYSALATVYMARGMDSKAKVALLRSVELDPNTPGYNDLAVVLTNDGQLEEGLHWARISLERNPRNPMVYYHVAGPLLSMRDDAAFEKWLAIWRQRLPNFRLREIEVIYAMERGKVSEALAEVRNMVASAPRNLEFASLLADVALVAGAPDAEKLNRDYFRGSDDMGFMNISYLVEPPRVRWAYLSSRRGDTAAAKRLLEQAEATAMDHWRNGVETVALPVQLVAIHALQGDRDGALEWLRRAYEHGWRQTQALRLDPMLANLRGDPRLEGLLRQMDADLARIRANSTEVRQLFEKTIPSLPPPAPPPPNLPK